MQAVSPTPPHCTAKKTYLVVLGQALGAAGRAGLDLAGGKAHRQVSDEGILGLAGAAGTHTKGERWV